jgi:E3 ubiquitin-protein ligase NEDD4
MQVVWLENGSSKMTRPHPIDVRAHQLTCRLVSDTLFNPDFALWSYSSINQMCMQINPSSGIANDEHLRYFHFTGRLLGKALFDRQIVAGHLVRPL